MTNISNSELARMASFASEAASRGARKSMGGGDPALEADARAWRALSIKARERANLEAVQILEQFTHTDIIDAGHANGWRVVGWLRDGWLSIRVGCRDMRLHEAREYWCEAHPRWADRQEIPPALNNVEVLAKFRGWGTEP